MGMYLIRYNYGVNPEIKCIGLHMIEAENKNDAFVKFNKQKEDNEDLNIEIIDCLAEHEYNDVEYSVKIINGEVYINGVHRDFDADMDDGFKYDDLNKKALLALACAMGYEATFLFEEMVDRLYEIVDEVETEEETEEV